MDNLYKVQEEDLERLKRILTVCFAEVVIIAVI